MKSNEGGLWTITLFAANEIPSVVVTFVALIMFLQMNIGVALSTLFATILLLPWVAQPLMRRLTSKAQGGRLYLHATELLLTVALLTFALTMGYGKWWTVAMMMGISVLSAWHDLLARHYFIRRTMMAQEKHHSVLKTLSSQMATVLTYGLMIMAVGVLQIYFRQRTVTYSWALGCYILAGAYLLLTMANTILLKTPGHRADITAQPWPWKQPGWKRKTCIMMLMLLPQGLMFYSRTIFLLARRQQGGLGCTLQEVGFAQGTIGVIAFLLGVAIGRMMQQHHGEKRMRWPLTICLGMSPAVYLAMTQWEPTNLWFLSAYTFMAQLFFGLGLNACRKYIKDISGERYQNAVNPLYIPIICLCILLPMALSGFMLERMDYEHFFLVDALCAPITWLAIAILAYERKNPQKSLIQQCQKNIRITRTD